MGEETREEAERRPGRRLPRRSPFQKGGKNGCGWRWEAGERGQRGEEDERDTHTGGFKVSVLFVHPHGPVLLPRSAKRS